MITRIRNANQIKSRLVYILESNLTLSIVKILKSEGFIENFEVIHQRVFFKKVICVYLKFKGFGQKPYINCITRISKPGVRVYTNSSNIPKVLGGIGIAVLLLLILN